VIKEELGFLKHDRNTLWHLLPPPHPRAGLYDGSRSLMKAKVYALPPCPVPEEERRGFARALKAWFHRYTALPVVGFGEVLYFPRQYPPELREIVLSYSGPRPPLKIRADGSKAPEGGGFGAIALDGEKIVAALQGGEVMGLDGYELELLALAHALILGLATNEFFVVETDSKGLVDRLLLTQKEASPLEGATRALMRVAQEAWTFLGLHYLNREENEEAHQLANKGRLALEEERGALKVLLGLLPSSQRPSAVRCLKRLALLEADVLEALADMEAKTAKALLAIAKEAPEVFAKALEEARALP
jgi:ribonuclease HI